MITSTKYLMTAGLVACALAGNALADNARFRPWIGGGIGGSHLDPDASAIPQSVTGNNDASLRGVVGLDINSRFGFELSYTNLGEASLSGNNSVSYGEVSGDVLTYLFANPTRRGYRIGLLPYARVGVSAMNNDSTLDFERENNISFDFGGGFEYGFKSGLAARAEVISIDTDAHYAGLGLIYRFRSLSNRSRRAAPIASEVVPPVAPPVIEAALPVAEEPVINEPVIPAALEPVFFQTNSAELDAYAQGQVRQMAQTLRSFEGQAYVVIPTGYADPRGSAAYNQALSQRRVNAVVKAFEDNDIDVNNFLTRASGETNQFGSENTQEGLQENRRVEILIERR